MAPLRLLVTATPEAAQRAVAAIREGAPAEASLATTAEALAQGVRDGGWSAIVVVPGGPLPDADIAAALAGATVPVVVVGPEVPSALDGVATLALVWEGLDAFAMLVEAVGGLPAAFLAPPPLQPAAPPAASPPALGPPPVAPPPVAPPPVAPPPVAPPPVAPPVFVAQANTHLADAARATAALPAALAAASAPPAPAPHPADSLAQHLPVGVYRSTPDGRILYANPALAEVLGAPSVGALADGFDVRRDLGYPRDAFVARLRAEGEVRNLVVTWTDRAGRTVHTRENARAVVGPDGQVLYYEGTMEDVTAEVEAQRDERVRARQHAAVAAFAVAADTAASPADLHAAAVSALHAATSADWILLVEHVRPVAAPPGTPAAQAFNQCAAWAGAFPTSGVASLDADPVFRSMPVLSETVLLRDAEANHVTWLPASVRELMRAHGMRSLGCFPLLRAGRPLGAFVVGYNAPHVFSSSERQTAEALAWHLAGHLARQQAEQELRDSEASLRFIAEHTGQALYRLRYAEPGADGSAGAPTFDYLSPAIEALTGYAAADLDAAGGLAALVERRDVLAGHGLLDGPPDAAEGEDPCHGHYLAVYRIQKRDGTPAWIENSAYPWCDHGVPVGLVGVLHDVTDRRRREDEQADEAQQLIARQAALVDLARRDDADTDALLARLGEAACEASGADEASVWLADGTRMACRAFYAPGRSQTVPAPSYPAVAFDEAMAGLRGQRVIALSDTTDAGALSALGLGAYVEAFAPRALLVAPVRRRGAAVGLVVVHRTDGPHAWSEGEADFVAALADTVALALEREERASAEAALRRSEARYRALSDLTSDYAFAVLRAPDGSCRVAWATDAFERITGHRVAALYDGRQRALIVSPESLDTAAAALCGPTDASAAGSEHEIEIVARDGSSRWIAHRARVAETAPDGTALVYHSGQDVTERKRFEADLVTAREQAEAGRAAAEEMARLKSAFLANMSHEIRTPLTSILGYAELLAGEVADEHRDYVDLIERGGRRLLDTLNSVLDLARLEADGVRPSLARLSVGDEVATVARMLTPLARTRGLDLSFDADADTLADLDATCLARVATNLIGNAIKFTPAGWVRVRVRRLAAHGAAGRPAVALEVADSGIGIAPEFVPHLFDEFRQEETGERRSHEGSGLGLAITHRLVTLMGGEVAVQSQRPGGSVFTVTFPAAAVATPPVAAPSPVAAPPVAPVSGDGTPGLAPLAPAAPSLPAPADAPAVDSAPSAPAPLAPPAMFDFFRSREAAPAPAVAAPEAPAAAPPAAAPPVAAPSPVAPSPGAPPAVAPVAGSPFAATAFAAAMPAPASPPAPTAESAPVEPVMIVRPARPAEPEQTPEPEDSRPRLLVVEDNADTRMLLERILRSAYHVTAVADARSALVEMNHRRFRGLVLDINLGGKETGADVLRVARTLDGYEDVFAIALTAYALPGDRDRLLEAGFDEYLSKPFTRQALLDTLAAGIRA